MSKWEEFKKNLGEIADKTVNKTRELTDSAALKIKIANKEAERDTEYKNLGKLAYKKLKKLEDHNSEETTAKISQALEKLDEINKELKDLKAEEKARKDAKEAEKAEKEAEKEAAKQAEKQAEKKAKAEEEKLNMAVMNDFNEARKEADNEYEKAKQAADDAK